LDSIIKNATELKQKVGEMEKNIPGWIQDHITNSENYIEQANGGYHELEEAKLMKLLKYRLMNLIQKFKVKLNYWKNLLVVNIPLSLMVFTE
jgi:hypothetical protein